LLKPSD